MAEKSAAAPAPVATPEEVAKLAAAQEEEWGTYMAIEPISYNGVPAYNVGDPVPVSNVKRHKYDEQGLVAKGDSAAAQKLLRAIHEQPNSVVETLKPVSLSIPIK
jgi:hypothetical protein